MRDMISHHGRRPGLALNALGCCCGGGVLQATYESPAHPSRLRTREDGVAKEITLTGSPTRETTLEVSIEALQKAVPPEAAPKAASGSVVPFQRLWDRLRVSEKIALVYLAYSTAATAFFPVWMTQGFTVALLNLLSATVITRFGCYSGAVDQRGKALASPAPSPLLAALRDAFPAVLILLAYRESGLYSLPSFLPGIPHHLNYLFDRWDHAVLWSPWALAVLNAGAPWLQRYLELCYSFCYPLVPLGLGALLVLRRWPRLDPGSRFDDPKVVGRSIDQFWTALLLAEFTCFMLFPFFPSDPPRLFFYNLPGHDIPGPVVQPLFRHLNFWILGHYGIQSSVFPSGHVAAVTAAALSVRRHWRRAGTFFMILAASIAVATFVCRYHYLADAVAGGLIGVTAYLISRRVDR